MTKRSVSMRLVTCLASPKFSLNVLCLVVTVFVLLQIWSFHITQQPILLPPSLFTYLKEQQQEPEQIISENETAYLVEKLRESVTFLPLKDLRFSNKPLEGHTWFMSSLYDNQTKGEVQYQEFPSESSKGRLLCLKGVDEHDGSWNYYALAWPQALPVNASLQEGLTFVSYNHYSYGNMWHGLSAMVPFVAWSLRNQCESPQRWVLYHWGELRFKMGNWLSEIITATYGQNTKFLRFVDENKPVCFHKAVVMRHNEGGMSRERRMEAFDLIRCKARKYCNISLSQTSESRIGMTLLMRTGPRSFKNESAVIDVFKRECKRVEGCELKVSYSNNLTFCEQVELMKMTDVLVSPHGAQLTNLVLMDRNSSVMEFLPKGWRKLAGVGQLVYQWGASWSGMRHEGSWHDPDGEICQFPDTDRRCMSVYKNGRIGYNETYFGEWAKSVLGKLREKKMENVLGRNHSYGSLDGCWC
ncbi:uncharacterized protein LOC9305276 [Arabidopsis lyrata subsp. lyrata]|uniref:uncharacterized protein LOC9305276 n=1 Tax=Arabidopsis lyrata subsp. lyrata TaxID=81972 RepID=UPI000A29D385|nr:uncharacterized protein LOC9305276 [Arabidopsis lyrata subsp. lyrata]|eukprot:XP_020872808.1 uncharacterized protein LOC9305276 [Arabidopsis lyrata subsp. lyrata]